MNLFITVRLWRYYIKRGMPWVPAWKQARANQKLSQQYGVRK